VQLIRSVVVLPAPFGPSRPKIAPAFASNEMPRNTLLGPSVFSRRSTLTAAGLKEISLLASWVSWFWALLIWRG
jgi:hypothetical protein